MSLPTIELELQLLKWSDDATAGPKLIFALTDDSALEPFRRATVKKGNRVGQRYMAVLVEINDDETPVDDRPKGGPLSILAAQWCRDPAFQQWINGRFAASVDCESTATALVRALCGVESRAEIDHNPTAKERFNTLIREPYRSYLEGNA